jgi:esterase/lipase superfamily enzyme
VTEDNLHRLLGAIEGKLTSVADALRDHIADGKEQSKVIQQIQMDVTLLNDKMPADHVKQHYDLNRWITKEKGILGSMGAIIVFLVSRWVPGAEDWFK